MTAPDHSSPGDPARDRGSATAGRDYTTRLSRLSGAEWKQRLDVQRPYRWNVRRLNLGRVLDIGCGIGRNLAHLGGNGVGIDHNHASVQEARAAGWEAYTPDDFASSRHAVPGAFDSLLLAHVVEHVSEEVAVEIVTSHLHLLRPGGRVVFICPQERGWASDDTHVRFVDFTALRRLADETGLEVVSTYSFPFPRSAGRFFPYNEFVVVARHGSSGTPAPER